MRIRGRFFFLAIIHAVFFVADQYKALQLNDDARAEQEAANHAANVARNAAIAERARLRQEAEQREVERLAAARGAIRVCLLWFGHGSWRVFSVLALANEAPEKKTSYEAEFLARRREARLKREAEQAAAAEAERQAVRG